MKRSPRGSKNLRGFLAIALDATKEGHKLVKVLHDQVIQDLSKKSFFHRQSLRLVTDYVPKSLSLAMDSSLSLANLLMGLWAQYDVHKEKENGPFLAMLNGVLGDYLFDSKSPLATEMAFIFPGILSSKPPGAHHDVEFGGDRILVLIHGSCLDETCWDTRNGNYGQRLAQDLDVIPVYIRYNSGRHIFENGEQLSQALSKLVDEWPGRIKSISFLAHSMGGLVVRSACYFADQKQDLWRSKVGAIVFLGTPHFGAPLERFGHEIYKQMNTNRYSSVLANLLKIRSAGVTDLRYGSILYRGGRIKNRFGEIFTRSTQVPLPKGVECYAVGATLNHSKSLVPMGDGIVPLKSALGEAPRPNMTLSFAHDRKLIVTSTNHMGLLASPIVYSKLLHWYAV